MRSKNYFLLLVAFICFSSFVIAQPETQIKVTIHNLPDSPIILGHHFNKMLYPDDTIKLNNKGYGVFEAQKAYPGGMYFIYLPTGKYFDILLSADQQFSIENDTTDFLQNMTINGSEENQLFYNYQKFLVKKREEASALQKEKSAATSEENKKEIDQKLDKISQDVKDYMNNLIKTHPDMFLSKFLLATKEIDVPEPPKDENGNITDSLFQYRYYKKHFFDNFDVSDPRLLRTPIYEDRINYYLDKIVPQIPDSINNEVDRLIEKSRSSDELFRFMLVSLFNKYAKSQIMGMDAVFVHIAEKYYIPEASWSDTAFISKLKKEVAKTEPLLIGKKAPDIQLVEVPADHFMAAADDDTLKKNVYVGDFFNLYDIQAKYTVLVFWEADCGHCKKAMPVLYDLYVNRLKKEGVEIIAVHMLSGEEGKIKWVNFVNDHGFYEWINAWNPYDYSYKAKYNVTSTPTVFVLDKDKKIIAKRIGMEQIDEVIKAYESMHNH